MTLTGWLYKAVKSLYRGLTRAPRRPLNLHASLAEFEHPTLTELLSPTVTKGQRFNGAMSELRKRTRNNVYFNISPHQLGTAWRHMLRYYEDASPNTADQAVVFVHNTASGQTETNTSSHHLYFSCHAQQKHNNNLTHNTNCWASTSVLVNLIAK